MEPVEVGESEPYQREVILVQQECLRRTGVIAYSGALMLSTHRMRFEPRGTLDRLVGAEEIQIRIEDITDVNYSKLDMTLNIQIRNGGYRFSGHGARRIHRRLSAYMDEREGKLAIRPDFRAGERVIVHEFGSLARPNEEATKGEFLLTDGRLRFQPTGRVERGFDADALLDVHLSQITEFEYDARNRELTVHAATVALGDEPLPFRLVGSRIPEIHAHLLAWQHMSQNTDPEGDIEMGVRSHSVEGAIHRGPLQTNGLISIAADSISFVPTGKLDRVLLSARVVRLAFEDICGVTIKGWPAPKLLIRGTEETLELSTDNVEQWFERLFEEMSDWLEHRTSIEQDEEVVLGSALAGWRFAVERDALEEASLSIPAIYRISSKELRCGILAQTRTHFRFAPIHQSKNEELTEIPVSEIAREYSSNKQEKLIRLRAFRARYCFSPAGGAKAVVQFWTRCRIPARVLRGSQLKRHGYSRLTGSGSYIRLTTAMGSVVESSPTWILAHSDGIGVVAPGPSGRSRFPGQNLSVEVRRHDGVYEFDTVALWAELLPGSIKVEDRGEYHLLIVEAPDEVRIYNERRTFRVPTQVQVRAYEMVKFDPEGQEVPTEELEAIREQLPEEERKEDDLSEWTFGLGTFLASMTNLSAEGCGLESLDPIVVGMRVSVDITVEGRMLALHGRIVWVKEPVEKDTNYSAGVAFQSLTQDQSNALTKAVMLMQRETLGED